MSFVVEMFTDGSSYIKGDTKCSSAAYNIYIKDTLITGGGKFFKTGTSNLGEVSAVLFGFKKLRKALSSVDSKLIRGPVKVRIYMDSLITCNGLRTWIYKWEKNQKDGHYINSSGDKVANQQVFKEIYKEFILDDKLELEFFHLNSHVIDTSLYKNNIGMIKKYYRDRHSDMSKVDPLPDKLFERTKFKKAKEEFRKKNGMSIDDIEFLRLLVYNKDTDILAGKYLMDGLERCNILEKQKKRAAVRKVSS